MLDIALVGTGGMMPMSNRHLSSALLRFEGRMVLIDCGEGTQVSARQVGWGFKTIDAICLTHFHADHVTGLPGLLLTIGHAGRDEELTIYGPIGVERIVRSLCVVAPEIPFPVRFVEIPNDGIKDAIQIPYTNFYLRAHPLSHGCVCFGFRLDIKRKGRFDADAAKGLGLPVQMWGKLQRGESVKHEGAVITPDAVMGDARRGLSVSYATDTRPPKGLAGFIQGSDLFICEGQYGDEELLPKARAYKHMIFSEAATIAKQGDVKEMWLTHFSPSLQNPKDYIKNARKIFQNTHVGYDRMTATLSFDED